MSDTPYMREMCLLCDEPMEVDQRSASDVVAIHRECALRNVTGGIGHLLSHRTFCMGDKGPDAGMDYRTSALMVALYIKRVGVEAALDSVQKHKEHPGDG